MANTSWRHSANTEVAQVWKGTITTTTNGHTYTVTMTDDDGNTAAITYTVVNPPDTTTTLVATGFITAWNASLNPLIAQFTASQSSGQVILTADTAGIPATFSTSGTGTWSGTGNTTSCVGNSDYATTANWALDAVPASTNDVLFLAGSVSAKYSLNQSAVDIADFRVFKGCSSQFGRFDKGLGHYLRIDPDLFRYEGNGTLAMFDIGSANISPYIAAYGSPSATGYHTVYIKGSNIATLTINKGNVGIAPLDADTATVATLNVGYDSTLATDSTVTVGSGVTLTTLNQTGGTVYLNCAATTVTNSASTTLYTSGSGAITTLNAYGTCYLNSTGTITTLNCYGTVDLTQSKAARTITTINLYPGSTLRYNSAITFTNKPFPVTTAAGTSTLVFLG